MAVNQEGVPWPEKINVDGNSATHLGLRLLPAEDLRWRGVEVRARRYLNNVVEQDHRAIKQRCAPMLGLKSFRSARPRSPALNSPVGFASSSIRCTADRMDGSVLSRTRGPRRW